MALLVNLRASIANYVIIVQQIPELPHSMCLHMFICICGRVEGCYVYHVTIKFTACHKCTTDSLNGSCKHPGNQNPTLLLSQIHIYIYIYHTQTNFVDSNRCSLFASLWALNKDIPSLTCSKIKPLIRRCRQIYGTSMLLLFQLSSTLTMFKGSLVSSQADEK